MTNFPSIEVSDFDNYSNTAHKIFCGAEAYAETSATIFPLGKLLMAGHGNFISRNIENSKAAINRKEIMQGYYGLSLTSAAFTNQAFALELYFKCLYFIENNTEIRGHDLKKLFDALSSSSKDKIRVYHDDFLNQPFSIKLREDMKKETGYLMETNFDTLLINSANLFVDLRYLYEIKSDKLGSGMIGGIMLSTQRHILDLKPEWPSILR